MRVVLNSVRIFFYITSYALETRLRNYRIGSLSHGMFWLLSIEFLAVKDLIGPAKVVAWLEMKSMTKIVFIDNHFKTIYQPVRRDDC